MKQRGAGRSPSKMHPGMFARTCRHANEDAATDFAAHRSTEYTGNVPILRILPSALTHQSVDVTPPALTAVSLRP